MTGSSNDPRAFCKCTRQGNAAAAPAKKGRGMAAFANLGIYGVPAPILRGDRAFRTIHAVRELEAWLASVGGFQHSYCDSFLSRDEYEFMFNLSHYETVRREYKAEGAFVAVVARAQPAGVCWAANKEYKYH